MRIVLGSEIQGKIEQTSEKLIDFVKIQSDMIDYGLDTIKKILIAIVILYIGRKVIHVMIKLLDKYFKRSKLEVGVTGFLSGFIKAALYTLMITLIIVEVLGIASSSIIAVLGSAGLSIGLALQGGLSNLAGGVLILILKPFRVEDYIMSEGIEGKVIAIDIFYTKLLTFDNKLVVMPNGTLANSNITNVTNEADRRLDLLIPISYEEDIERVRRLIMNIIEKSEYALLEKEVNVFVNHFEQNALQIGVRVWVLKDNYWNLKWELLEDIKKVFDENKIYLQINQMNVNIKQ